MKKLIALAAVLAVGGAFAACDYAPKATSVYKWKFSGKTTFGVKVKEAKSKGTYLCGYNQNTNGSGQCPVRAPASLKIEGYTWYCEKQCEDHPFETVADTAEIFWQKKPFKASLKGGVETDVANIIGKKGKQFEAAGTATFTEFISRTITEGTYTLTYAGLGKFDKKHGRVKSVSGNFAGFLDQPHYVSKDKCVDAGYWECDDSLTCNGTSVAYGKWSAKYQKSASKKFDKKGKLPKIPSWVLKHPTLNGNTTIR